MRASQSNLVGSIGQDIVSSQFKGLGWGVAPNPVEHDLGTDLWLMARDSRLFDLGALVGAQVKSGPTFFVAPKYDSAGSVGGWWYRENDTDHFEYWVSHRVPHLLVLHDEDTGVSYWVHVTNDAVQSTGRGAKILVPQANTVDLTHLSDLLRIALTDHGMPYWQGVSRNSTQILATDRLRHALIAPRLLTRPIGQGNTGDYTPDEAIARLLRMRIDATDVESAGFARLPAGLRPKRSAKLPTIEQARASTAWQWRFFAALYDVIVDDAAPDVLEPLVRAATARPFERAAATAVLGALAVERGDPWRGCVILEQTLEQDTCGPVDHAWLQTQLACARAEIGQVDVANTLALEAIDLRLTSATDVTAMAIVGAASDLIYRSGWHPSGAETDTVFSHDTLASWWRTQEVAAGLQNAADDTFERWARSDASPRRRNHEALKNLRSATLIAGMGADRRGWRSSMIQLAQAVLTLSDSENRVELGLRLLRNAGARSHIEQAVEKQLEAGSPESVRDAISEVDLNRSTRTSLHADLQLLKAGADVISDDAAEIHVCWLIQALESSDSEAPIASSYNLEMAAIETLGALLPALNNACMRRVVDHVVTLEPFCDDMPRSHDYANLITSIPPQSFTEDDLTRIEARSDTLPEISDAFEAVLSARNPERRSELEQRIAGGDVSALSAYGDVRDLRHEIAVQLVAALHGRLEKKIEGFKEGSSTTGFSNPAADLVMINAWHPAASDWNIVVDYLRANTIYTNELRQPLEYIRQMAERIPGPVVDKLVPVLQQHARREHNRISKLMEQGSIAGVAVSTLATLKPELVVAESTWGLLEGGRDSRIAAATVMAATGGDGVLDSLAVMAHDPDPWVRAIVANRLTKWIIESNTEKHAAALCLVQRILNGPGTLTARLVSVWIRDSPVDETATALAEAMRDHISAGVRRNVEDYLAQMAHSPDSADVHILRECTVAELRAIAKSGGIRGFSRMKKANLISAIEATHDVSR
ncbi:DUF4365 domain-containing protein [Gordonia rhizosphera]|nr:DUF4365 domain-containing protein [Gordonia rhizosphera]